MPRSLPDAARIHPMTTPDGTPIPGTVWLKSVLDHPQIDVGEFTYASDFDPPPPDGWAARLVPYLSEVSQDRLVIGKYCQICQGVRFITASANHTTNAVSTFPFRAFDPDRREGFQPDQRETRIGHDVWLGHGAIVGPGAQIGNGVIVGAGSVVRGKVPDYAMVMGNPARVQRMRFAGTEIGLLLRLAWWHWPPEMVTRAQAMLEVGDIRALERFARSELSDGSFGGGPAPRS